MTRFLITDPGTAAHSAKNVHAAPGLPNQPENHLERNPMVGTNPAAAEPDETLAREQAAGLRALAAMIEQNLGLARCLRYALGDMFAPVIESDGDPRARLAEFHAAAHAHGATVTVRNADEGCHVAAEFGPVGVRMMGAADLLAGGGPRYPRYESLVFGESAGGER